MSRLSSVNGIAHPHPSNDGTAAQIRAIAELGAHLFEGGGCLIAWQGARAAAITRVVSASHLNARLDSFLAAIERVQRDRGHRAKHGDGALRFSNDELVAACGTRLDDRAYVGAALSISSNEKPVASVTAILIAPSASAVCDLNIPVELVARSTMIILHTRAAVSSRDFWREQASDSGARLAAAKVEGLNCAAARDLIECTATAAEKLRPRDRWAGLGALFAKLGPFDAWMLALAEEGVLRLSASAGLLLPIPRFDAPDARASALTESFRRQSTIVRSTSASNGRVYAENGVFARYAGYVCVPFASGVIALAAHEKIAAVAVERIEAVAQRLASVIATWLLEAEAARLRGLVRNLGLRMFGAIDAERARIARDLHDHQAQLLAAARIGIEAGPDQARGIFKQLEDSLRLRVRELKPPSLGRSTLSEGLRYELRRLADGGIKTRLLHLDRMNALTRPIQQLCYQVAREALANVVRHANASRVEIDIDKHGSWVRLSVLDNGKGIEGTINGSGIGLDGLSERLELMGGRLRVESKAGSTRLVAEIPELA